VRAILRTVLVFAGLAAVAASIEPRAVAGGSVGVIVLKEHAVGSTSQAQPYLDKLMAVAARQNGWGSATGHFVTSRSGADSWIQSSKPQYGILSLAAFLAFKSKYNLDPIGQALVSGGGGQQYFVVSQSARDLAGCKGKRLATDHADDARFLEKVVAAGAWTLGDFSLLKTRRPGEAGRKVVTNDAECALIDDAQLSQLGKVPGGGAVKPVWSSARMPPMVVVAFPSANAAERKAFQGNLPKLCVDGKQACDEVGLNALKAAQPSEYAGVVALYGK
jgi:hypothetical protein